jgi:hypothetical protein
MPKRQEFCVFSYIFFSVRHSPLPFAGACCAARFVEHSASIAAEPPSIFQNQLNLLWCASSCLKLCECGIFEIDKLVTILLKSVRSNCSVLAWRTINVANKFCEKIISCRNSSLPAPATDIGLINPKFIQVELPTFRISMGAH